jgi:hypothetical protein
LKLKFGSKLRGVQKRRPLSPEEIVTARGLCPLPAVYFIPVCTKGTQVEFALTQRHDPPYRNTLFLPGGMIPLGRTTKGVLWEFVLAEFGRTPWTSDCRLVGVLDVATPSVEESGAPWHCIWNVFVVHVDCAPQRFRWYAYIKRHWPEPVREALRMANFRYDD